MEVSFTPKQTDNPHKRIQGGLCAITGRQQASAFHLSRCCTHTTKNRELPRRAATTTRRAASFSLSSHCCTARVPLPLSPSLGKPPLTLRTAARRTNHSPTMKRRTMTLKQLGGERYEEEDALRCVALRKDGRTTSRTHLRSRSEEQPRHTRGTLAST